MATIYVTEVHERLHEYQYVELATLDENKAIAAGKQWVADMLAQDKKDNEASPYEDIQVLEPDPDSYEWWLIVFKDDQEIGRIYSNGTTAGYPYQE